MSGFGEIIGVVSAVTALAELSGRILRQGYSYTKTAINAPIQIRQLLSEVSSLDTLLHEVIDLAGTTTNSPRSTLVKLATDKRLDECEGLLVDAMRAISRCEKQEGHAISNFKRQAQWPLEKKETARLLQDLQRLRSYFDSAIAIDSARKLDSIAKGIQSLQDAEEQDALVSWICPADTDVNTNLRDAQRARFPGTCQWLLENPQYTTWKKGVTSQILWINGPPGSGKTVMSGTVVQDLEKTYQGSEHAVLYFYLDHRDSNKRSLTAILSQAIRQLLELKPECIKQIKSLRDTNNIPAAEDISTAKLQMDLLKDVSRGLFKGLFLVIDALDEGPSTAEVLDIMNCVSYLTQNNDQSQSHSTISVVCTSRRLPYIKQRFDQIGSIDVRINADLRSEVHRDIRTYAIGQLETVFSGTSPLPSGRPSDTADLKQQAVEAVVTKSGGLFLQAKYHLDLLTGAPNMKRFRKVLENLPNGLKDTYNLILCQIRQKHSVYMPEILRMLHWIAGVKEPTTVSVLTHVAVIEPDDTSLDPEAMWRDTDKLLLMLSSLITVDQDHGFLLVRFSHYTVREHLSSDEIKTSPEAVFHLDPQVVHRELARVTLQYLSFEQFAQPDPAYNSEYEIGVRYYSYKDSEACLLHTHIQNRSRCRWMTKRLAKRSGPVFKQKLDDYPLLAYASHFWFEHVNDAGFTPKELLSLVPDLDTWFTDPEGKDPRFLNWAEVHSSGCIRSDNCEKKQPPLFFALLFGVLPWVQILASSPNLPASVWTSNFEGGWNPMTLAASSQSIKIFDEVLLHAGMDKIDTPAASTTKNGKTALHVAAELGDSKMIGHLLSKGASPWALTRSGTTPLYRVARTSSMRGLQLIYESVEPDKRTEYLDKRTWDDWTALINAVIHNRIDAVEWLLEQGADWSVRTFQGHTALSLSIQTKRSKIQDVLLRKIGKGAVVKSQDLDNNQVLAS